MNLHKSRIRKTTFRLVKQKFFCFYINKTNFFTNFHEKVFFLLMRKYVYTLTVRKFYKYVVETCTINNFLYVYVKPLRH